MILGDAFANQKEIFEATGAAPKSVVFMHVNDTFGTSMQKGIDAVLQKANMPYKIAETIAYDPAARDLSVEVSKAKADRRRGAAAGEPPQRRDRCSRASSSSSAGRRWACSAWGPAGTRTSTSRRWASSPTVP